MSVRTLRTTVIPRIFAGGSDETSVRASLQDLGLEHPERQAYIPSAWWILRWLLPQSAVGPEDTFVEFGCGKGRIVLDAAQRYRFKTVIGVELSEELVDVARALVVQRGGRLRCKDVRIEAADATRFPVPDDMTYAYLFNPFTGETFMHVLDNIIESLDRAPRKVTIIYVNPVEHEALMGTGRFRLLRHVRTTRLVTQTGAAIYESL